MGVLTELLKKAPLGMLVLIFLLCGDAYAHKKKNHKDILNMSKL